MDTSLEIVLGLAIAAVVVVAARRSLAAAFAICLLALVGASCSIPELRDAFLTARWPPLLALAAVLAWPPRAVFARPSRFEWLLVAAVAVALASVAWSVDPRLTAMRAVSFGVLLFVVVQLARRERAADLCLAIAAVTVLLGAGSILLWLVRPDTAVFVGELRGLFENQNGLGLFLGLTFPLVLAVLESRGGDGRWLPLAALPFAVVIVLADARAGLLALGVGIVVYELGRRAPLRLVLGVGVAAVGVAAATAAFSHVPTLEDRPAAPPVVEPAPAPGSGDGDGEEQPAPAPEPQPAPRTQSRLGRLLGARDEGWSAAAELIADRPLVGYGFGTGDRLFDRYPEVADFTFFQGDNPGNSYLQLALEVGLLGAAVFLAPLALAAAAALRPRAGRLAPAQAAFGALLAGGLAAGMFESLLTAAGAPWAPLIWLAAAVVVRPPAPDP
jgi:hypothetical protein